MHFVDLVHGADEHQFLADACAVAGDDRCKSGRGFIFSSSAVSPGDPQSTNERLAASLPPVRAAVMRWAVYLLPQAKPSLSYVR